MKKILVLFFFLPGFSFGQTNLDYSVLVPANLKVKSILDPINYIESEPRLAIIKYLNLNKLNIENYFIDSSVHRAGDTLSIQVWDRVAFQTMKRYEKKKDSLDKINSTSKEKKLTFPKPVGNPGNCFTAYFDTKKNILIATEFWQ